MTVLTVINTHEPLWTIGYQVKVAEVWPGRL
jgi:hypothetical protein